MKNIINSFLIALLLMLAVTSCEPDDKSDLGLGRIPTAEDADFSMTPSVETPNVISFTNTSSRVGNSVWDFGNGQAGKGNVGKASYPYKGEYTVSMTLYTTGGAVTISKTVIIENDDLSLLDTPTYRKLTGGLDNTKGKVWVFDQYNNFTKEVAKETGKDIKGHMGLSPLGGYSQEWWGAEANAKSDWSLYSNKFTFKQDGLVLNIANDGVGYGRNATSSKGNYPNTVSLGGDDVKYDFSGGDFTFYINEGGQYPALVLSGNANLGYYCGTQEYEIIYQTEEVMALRVANTTESQDWVFIYCLEELNVEPLKPELPVKSVTLTEDFESEKPIVAFVGEDMGASFSLHYDNPARVPINESVKVCSYHKTAALYSNLSYTADDLKFDLSTNNKVRMKVFIPHFNVYEAEKLQPKVAVKLQDSSLGGNAWTTQVEIAKEDLVQGKWVELEFDFSSAKDRVDFNKIVIQFGGEGHDASGIFFFDDFTFSN